MCCMTVLQALLLGALQTLEVSEARWLAVDEAAAALIDLLAAPPRRVWHLGGEVRLAAAGVDALVLGAVSVVVAQLGDVVLRAHLQLVRQRAVEPGEPRAQHVELALIDRIGAHARMPAVEDLEAIVDVEPDLILILLSNSEPERVSAVKKPR